MSKVPEDYNKGGLYTFIGVMVFVIGFFILLVLFMPAMDLGQEIEGSQNQEQTEDPSAQADEGDSVQEKEDSLDEETSSGGSDSAAPKEE